MKAFIISMVAMVVISIGAALVLQQFDESAAGANVTPTGATRI